ncbi:PRD domain-containing protein [Schnuerera sp. xch1]|uniref:PRD domain-containing protein n=1 Tax=Schnuerera sp. xch1 TaxID=2874283 RepID=UPI001CBE64E7|nr:PRD domain-containing protein [Schnuerera sp. xch1]MBZ2175893.1 PRD domain-containing protein [Schnuerera sp. xch1]
MDDNLMLRLNLLTDSGEIDESIKDVVIDFIERIEKNYSLKVTEENGSMLVSHLAMALGRIKRGEEIDAIDEEIFKEVKETEIYNEMPKYYSEIEGKLDIEIPQAEKDYIALHVSTLIQKFK